MLITLDKIFRDFSVRGVVPDEFNPVIVEKLGRAFGTYLQEHEISSVVVGRDARASSSGLAEAAINGLLSTGCHVIDIGLVSTPVWNWATSQIAAAGGVMITASHNPPIYNGVKFRVDDPLVDGELARVKELALRGRFRTGSGQLSTQEIWSRYRTALAPFLRCASRRRTLAVDAGNGVIAGRMSTLLREQGHRVIAINDTLDATFSGRGPDPSTPGALVGLSETVVRERADLGLAFDGDGDRLIVVDDQGRVLLGDEVLIVLARHLLSQNPGRPIVYDLSATRALGESIRRFGGVPVKSRVGYPYVYDAVKRNHALLGGELSGHFFFGDSSFRYDDATVAALRLLCALNELGQSLSAVLADIPRYVRRAPEKVEVAEADKRKIMERLTHLLEQDGPVELLDGVSVDLPGGWALVRPSGTEPLLRISIEGKTELDCQRIHALILSRLDQAQKAASS